MIQQHHRAVAMRRKAAAGGGLDSTSLVMWYDFGNNSDSHGTYTLTDVGTPSYTGGTPAYGSSTTSNDLWSQADIVADTGAGGLTSDFTWVTRFRVGTTSGTQYVYYRSGRFFLRVTDGEIIGQASNVSLNGGASSITANTWTTVMIAHDDAANTDHLYIDSATETTSASSGAVPPSGTIYIGGLSATGGINCDFDYLFGFSRLLTSGERQQILDGGSGWDYSDVS